MGTRWPWQGLEADDQDDEWQEVPVYTAIKRTMQPVLSRTFDVHARGAHHVPHEGGVILASNHASYLDPIFIGLVVDRPIRWLAKADLFRHPLAEKFFRSAGQIKVDRVSGGNQSAVNTSIRLVEEGRVTGIFPEGSRSLDGRLRRARTGVARVALQTGAPVVPVAMTSYQVLPKHTTIPSLGQPLTVHLGAPVRYQDMEGQATDRTTCRKVADELMDRIGGLLEQARTHRNQLLLERD